MRNSKSLKNDLYSRNSRTLNNADPLAFPPVTDAYVGAAAIGLTSVYAGRRLILGERVVTGSWRRKDGTRSYKYSRWVTFEREMVFEHEIDGVKYGFRQLMNGRALLPENEYAVVMTFAIFVKRKAAA